MTATETPIAEAAFIAATIDRLFAPLWQQLGGNPLAQGHFCEVCGSRLDKADRACPFAPHDEPKPRRTPRRQSATRLAILNESPLLYAMGAA